MRERDSRAAVRPGVDSAQVADAGRRADRPAVTRLALTDFRNYETARLDVTAPAVVLTGPNGAGKTNLLEAVSFLAPGRGLRRATLSTVRRVAADAGKPWAVSARLLIGGEEVRIGTGLDLPEAADIAAKPVERRVVRVDGVPIKSQARLSDILTVSWLTPQMDRLFIEGASNRRRFLDRLVHAFDAEHAGRVNAHTHALRERSRLLKAGGADPHWLSALEDQAATAAVAVAAARLELVARLTPELAQDRGPFPAARLSLEGAVEQRLETEPALAVEDWLRERLAASRPLEGGEAASVPGPHRTDLAVTHLGKDMPATACSTGEQKALLVAIVLAHAGARARGDGKPPILLMDEVAAHLDRERRETLFDLLLDLGGQVWLTGTDRSLFEALEGRAQFHTVTGGAVSEPDRSLAVVGSGAFRAGRTELRDAI